MKKLVEALRVIKQECTKHSYCDKNCPLFLEDGWCIFETCSPSCIDIIEQKMDIK